jgi:hypothetical protein
MTVKKKKGKKAELKESEREQQKYPNQIYKKENR